MFFDLAVFTFIMGLLVAAGLYKVKRVRSESAYLFAERKTGWAALSATLVMTEFNSATLLGFSSLGYAAGFWALTLPTVFLFGLLFYAAVAAKKWKRFDGLSVAGFFREKYGVKIGGIASLLLLSAMLIFSAAYIKSLALFFQPLFFNFSLWAISGALVAVILIMSLRGGLVAIIRTDVVSFILMLLFFPLLIFFAWKTPAAGMVESVKGPEILPLHFLFSLVILTMFTYILAPWYGQKMFAAKSPKVAYWSVFTAAILVFLFYGAAIFATALLREREVGCSSEQALPHLIGQIFPAGYRGFAYAILFATSATTLTGVWNAMSAMIVGDFLKKGDARCNRAIRITLVFAALSYVLANTLVDRVFDKLILANIPVASLAFGLLAGFYWKRASSLGVYCSILTGLVGGCGAYLIFGEAGGYTWYWAVYVIPFSFLAGIAGSYLRIKFKAAESVQ